MKTTNEKIDLIKKTKHLWHCTYCEPTQGWPGQWTVIWRSEDYYGKLSSSIESKERPTDTEIEKLLSSELAKRFKSTLRCDATRVAKLFLSKPYIAEIDGCKKEIENLVVRNSDELADCFVSHGIGHPLANQLFQRIKDIACAQEAMSELDNFIDRNIKKESA